MANKSVIILFVLVFSLGWVANGLFSSMFVYTPDRAMPVSFLGFNQSLERDSPADHITKDKIHVYKDRIELDVSDATWSEFTNTNSMDPVLDELSNGIEIIPKTPDDIHVGDVISYVSLFADGIFIHRVINKGVDDRGPFFIVKGDNNPTADPGKIRFEQVKGLLVGIIY